MSFLKTRSPPTKAPTIHDVSVYQALFGLGRFRRVWAGKRDKIDTVVDFFRPDLSSRIPPERFLRKCGA